MKDVLPQDTTSDPSFLVALAAAPLAWSYEVSPAQHLIASLHLGEPGAAAFLPLTLQCHSSLLLLGHAHAQLHKVMSKIFQACHNVFHSHGYVTIC